MCTGIHPYIAADGTALVRMVYSMHGSTLINTLHFQRDSGWSAGGLDSLVAAVATHWGTYFKPKQVTTATLVSVQAVDLTTQTGSTAEQAVNLAGTLAEADLPNNVTLAIKFTTGLRGRSYRGRMYWIGLSEPKVTGDAIDATFLPLLVQAVRDFIDKVKADTASDFVLVSYCNNHAWRTSAAVHPITAISSDGVVDSQRKRLLGRGN